jgi:hypothetical protein
MMASSAAAPRFGRSHRGFPDQKCAGVRLIDQPVLNTVLVMVVVTPIMGPKLTE